MKFTDGYWQIRDGYHVQNPADIRDIVQRVIPLPYMQQRNASSAKGIH